MAKLTNSLKNLGKALNGVEPEGRYIKQILKSMGATLTGKEIEGKSLDDIINSIADGCAGNDLIKLVAYFSDNVLGKATSDLQDNVVVGANSITGTLKYVTGYTGFSSKVEEQSGNYLCVYTPIIKDGTITMELIGGTSGVKTLDDGIMVLRITENTTALKLVATDGTKTFTKTFTFDLELQENENI